MNAIVFVLAEIQAIIARSFYNVTEHYRPVWRLADPKKVGERPLEDEPIAVGEKFLESRGWSPGKHTTRTD